MPKRLLVVFAAAALGFGLAQYAARSAAPSWWPDRERERNVKYFREVLQLVKENYVEEPKANYDELTRAALKGMLGELDPHSEFLSKEDFATTEEELGNQFGGVGIQVEQRDGKVVVISPIAGTPAEQAGVRRGDQLVKVDGKPLESPTLDKTVRLIRGEPDTEVTVTMFRPSANREIDFKLQRKRIKLQSVRHERLLRDGIGYVQVTQFSERTGEEFEKAVATLEKQGMRALVLDLRNNPGGLLDAAVEVCEAFFAKNELVVYTQGRSPDSREEHHAGGGHAPRTYPIAVLVNGGTASAAEIVAGALKDTRRAVIVGEKTFGKGSVQSVLELRDGEGLRLTTARYYTPGGLTIHEKGILPHVEIEMSADDESKVRLQQSRPDLTAPAEFSDRFGFQPIEDIQLLAAEELLVGVLATRGK
jgi:carboxyl-terminal processing protease